MLNNLFLLATEAVDPAMAENATGQMVSMVVTMVLMFAVIYFMMIRPQRKKDKAAKDMLSKLTVGDRVVTIGGIYGTIAGIKDDVVTLAVGPGQEKVKLVFERRAIYRVEENSIANDGESLV